MTTEEEEEFYDDYITEQDPSFRSHTDITPDELTSTLHSLDLLGGELYLGLQVTNLTVIDLDQSRNCAGRNTAPTRRPSPSNTTIGWKPYSS